MVLELEVPCLEMKQRAKNWSRGRRSPEETWIKAQGHRKKNELKIITREVRECEIAECIHRTTQVALAERVQEPQQFSLETALSKSQLMVLSGPGTSCN